MLVSGQLLYNLYACPCVWVCVLKEKNSPKKWRRWKQFLPRELC